MKIARITKENPYESASWLSKLTFAWMASLLRDGWKKNLDYCDVFRVCRIDDPKTNSQRLEEQWLKDLKRDSKATFLGSCVRTFLPRYIWLALPMFIVENTGRVAQPFIIGVLTRYFTADSDVTVKMAFIYAGFLILSSLVFTFVRTTFYFNGMREGLKARSAIQVLLYNKVLKLSQSTLGETSTGQILNIMANDLLAIEYVAYDFLYIGIAPFQTVIVIWIMWQYIGVACVAGVVMLLLFIPFQGMMGRFFERYRRQTTLLTDKRIKLMNEIINAIRLIKVYCWEASFATLVSRVRRKEVGKFRKKAILNGVNLAMNILGTRIMLFCSLVTFILIGGTLNAETVFCVMSLYNVLASTITGMLPYAVASTAEAIIACRRVQKLLQLDEKVDRAENVSLRKGQLAIRKYCAKWNGNVEKTNLEDITLSCEPGKLVMVVGPVGSGKTCLLQSLLNENHDVSGSCGVGGTVSYAPQESWCFGGTIRENILLGNEYDATRYKRVVHVCGLERDFELFPDADMTVTGEKGYTLSGGQKARITLARAVYNEADVYLLDDPLSAVDPAVARHIFEKCVKDFLSCKTVVLVTHQLQFLSGSDQVVLLDDGKSLASGSYSQLMDSGVDFLSFLGEKTLNSDKTNNAEKKERRATLLSEKRDALDSDDENKQDKVGRDDETSSVGSVRGAVYWAYLCAGSSMFLVLFVFASIVGLQLLSNFCDLWLSDWTRRAEEMHQNCLVEGNSSSDERNTSSSSWTAVEMSWESEQRNLLVYTVLSGSLFVLAFVRTLGLFVLCLRSSIELHNSIFSRLLQAPMAFFESNPVGRLLNRFTRDMGLIDSHLPDTISSVINGLISSLGIVVVAAVVSPYLLIPAIALGALAVPVRSLYMATARDLKRLDAITKSPLFGHVTTSFDGLCTIRAFGFQSKFEEQFLHYVDDSFACKFASQSASRTMGFTLELFTVVFVAFVTLFLVAVPDGIPGGDAGLAMSSALMLSGMFQYAVRESAELENQMISVERVLEYGQLEPEEDEAAKKVQIGGEKVHDMWLTSGKIEYKKVSLTYGKETDEKTVLKDINFTVKSGEKIGIVGRTGAGKTSLISVLFRLALPSGKILIDGVDTTTITLKELRSKLSIIPQDPVLFSGDIRKNLDPFDEYKDDVLWKCLNQAKLSEVVKQMPGGLDASVTDGGSNLSAGQRQLLCLARALLRNNKVLVLDEATANVDHETDQLIQSTIRNQFKNCTVLTVAHRLNTIIDMDKVLVLDAGHAIEFDEPHVLLEKNDGHFLSMVEKCGLELAAVLKKAAKCTYDEKHQKSD